MVIIETKHHHGSSTLFLLRTVICNSVCKWVYSNISAFVSVWYDLCNRCRICVRPVPVCVSESESYCTSLVTFSVALASCCPMVAVSMAIGLAAEQRGNAQSALCSHTSQDFKHPTAFEAIIHHFSPLFANLVVPNMMKKTVLCLSWNIHAFVKLLKQLLILHSGFFICRQCKWTFYPHVIRLKYQLFLFLYIIWQMYGKTGDQSFNNIY